MSLSPAVPATAPLLGPVLVPHWILTVLDRAGISLSQFTQLETMSQLLSLEDLAQCLALNTDHAHWVWGQSLPPTTFFSMHWSKSPELYAQVLDLKASVTEQVVARLFAEGIQEARFDAAFALRQSLPDTLAVIVYPGCFAGDGAVAHRKNLVREVIRTSYGLEPFSEVAKGPLFAIYLKDL